MELKPVKTGKSREQIVYESKLVSGKKKKQRQRMSQKKKE